MKRATSNRVRAATAMAVILLCAAEVSAQAPQCGGTEVPARVGLVVDPVRGEADRPLYFHQLAITNPVGYTGEALADIAAPPPEK